MEIITDKSVQMDEEILESFTKVFGHIASNTPVDYIKDKGASARNGTDFVQLYSYEIEQCGWMAGWVLTSGRRALLTDKFECVTADGKTLHYNGSLDVLKAAAKSIV